MEIYLSQSGHSKKIISEEMSFDSFPFTITNCPGWAELDGTLTMYVDGDQKGDPIIMHFELSEEAIPASVSPTTASFNGVTGPEKITVTFTPGDFKLISIKDNDYVLRKDVDYSIEGNICIINQIFLESLDSSPIVLRFIMTGVYNPTLTINVSTFDISVSTSELTFDSCRRIFDATSGSDCNCHICRR